MMFVVLAALAVTCVFYVSMHGDTFTSEQNNHAFQSVGNIELSATSQDENIIVADKVYFKENNLICVDVHSVNPGDTKVTVLVNMPTETGEEQTMSIEIPFHVTHLGTVIQADNLNFDGFLTTQFIILAGFFLVMVVTGYTFIEGFVKAQFSYSMVVCGGVALFTLFLIVVCLYNMQWMNTFRNFLWDISDSGFNFALYTTPFMLLLAGAIAFSNIWLMRHEGRFATTNYHIFRGYILSKKHRLDAQGISAKTKWYFYPNAFLREFVGLLYDKKWFILLTVFLILAFYTLGVYLLFVSAP